MALGLSGCSQQDVADKTAPKDAVALVEKTVDDVRAQKTAELAKDLAPGLLKLLGDQDMVHRMQAVFPRHPITAVHVETWQKTTYMGNVLGRDTGKRAGDTATYLVLRYEFEGGDAVLVTSLAAPRDGVLRLNRFSVEALPAALIAHNAPTAHWTEFGGRHVFLGIALIAVLFMITSSVKCVRMPDLRYKWLWFILIWVSAIQFTLNWTTEKVYVLPLTIKFPPVWAQQTSPYDPMMIWFLVPLGAIIFRSWMKIRGEQGPQPKSFGS
jgi:hypothetical protein